MPRFSAQCIKGRVRKRHPPAPLRRAVEIEKALRIRTDLRTQSVKNTLRRFILMQRRIDVNRRFARRSRVKGIRKCRFRPRTVSCR